MTFYKIESEFAGNLQKALRNLENKQLKVGWFERSRYPGEPNKKGLPVATVAASNEFGNPVKSIPARPFIRPTIREKQNEWASIIEKGSISVIKGNHTLNQVLEALGLKVVGDIKKTISQIWTPPLSPRTIAARLARRSNKKLVGNLNKPLIDTHLMFDTIDNKIEDV
jgi:hypothetical protein